MNTILSRYNPWWENGYVFPDWTHRKTESLIYKNMSSRAILLLTGLRRIGKTTIMKQCIRQLITEGISPQRILYISLDDYQLLHKSIHEIIEEFRKIHKIKLEEKIYVFLDEITYKEYYEIQLKNIYDNQSVKIIATSSSASLLRNRRPYLTGRHITIELLPLDYQEFLLFKKISVAPANAALHQTYFDEYMQTGGVPEYVIHGDTGYLNQLVDDIIYKDIIGHFGVKNPQLMKDYFLLLMERAGKSISINKIAKILGIPPDSSSRYQEMFASTYLIYTVKKHGKTNEKLLSPKKIYAPDLGIRCAFTGFRDLGSLFENYVYLKIKHLNPEYIYENTTEIDFFTQNKILIESKYHDEELSVKQNELFKRTKAEHKLIVRTYSQLDDLLH